MSDPAAQAQAFAAVVTDTIGHLNRLHAALEEERRALTGTDPALLQDTVRHKLEVLAALEQAVLDRDRVQHAAGMPPGLDGGERLVREHLPQLRARWDELLTLCREVDRCNATNGRLATQGARLAREALGLLTGRDQTPQLYGPERRKSDGLAGQSFGRV